MYTNEELEAAISANRDAYHSETFELMKQNDKQVKQIAILKDDLLSQKMKWQQEVAKLKLEIKRLEDLLKNNGNDQDHEIYRLNKII